MRRVLVSIILGLTNLGGTVWAQGVPPINVPPICQPPLGNPGGPPRC